MKQYTPKPDVGMASSPNHRGSRRDPITAIIVHHSGAMSDPVPWLVNPDSKVSYHYVIDRQGEIVQLVADSCEAWHAGHGSLFSRGNCNKYSIGIGLVGNGNIDQYTTNQIEALAELCAYLCYIYPIDMNHIVGHSHVDPERKTDPGKYFPWDRFFDSLSRRLYK
jgi:N-acetyl-anhydromuramyl-L-alanine amidase AmpD